MGTKIPPTYAILILAYLEENLYEIIDKTCGNNVKVNLIRHGKDIYMIASYSAEAFVGDINKSHDINKLHDIIQNLNPEIKFTLEHSSFHKKKRKWPNHQRYLQQTYRHPTIPSFQKPPPTKWYKIHPLNSHT